VKAAVSSLPTVGSPGAELLGLIFGPPLEKRREDWLNPLAQAVGEIQDKDAELTPDKLSQTDVFVTTTLNATQTAIRTHQKEKLDALRNAVTNAALPGAPDETVQQIFLNLVDAPTSWHLRVLSFLANPPFPLKDRMERLDSLPPPHFLEGMPELKGQPLDPQLQCSANEFLRPSFRPVSLPFVVPLKPIKSQNR
jgi:hypothetical protein